MTQQFQLPFPLFTFEKLLKVLTRRVYVIVTLFYNVFFITLRVWLNEINNLIYLLHSSIELQVKKEDNYSKHNETFKRKTKEWQSSDYLILSSPYTYKCFFNIKVSKHLWDMQKKRFNLGWYGRRLEESRTVTFTFGWKLSGDTFWRYRHVKKYVPLSRRRTNIDDISIICL